MRVLTTVRILIICFDRVARYHPRIGFIVILEVFPVSVAVARLVSSISVLLPGWELRPR